jgi:hypothetical protein
VPFVLRGRVALDPLPPPGRSGAGDTG